MEIFLEFVMEYALKSIMKYVLLKILKNHGLLKYALCPPIGGRPDENFGRP